MITALAIARLTTLVTEDAITEPVREAFIRLDDKYHNALTGKLLYFIGCRRCVSVWAAAVVLLLNKHPTGTFLVKALAGSQAALTALAVNERVES